MSDEDKETKSAGQDFRERVTVHTAMETLGLRFTANVAAIETYEEQCGKQHFRALTELFSSRYTRSRPLLCPLDPSRALCLLFLAFRVDEFFFIEFYLCIRVLSRRLNGLLTSINNRLVRIWINHSAETSEYIGESGTDRSRLPVQHLFAYLFNV